MGIYGTDILNEYSGKEIDNKRFANCMEELGKIGKYYVQVDQLIAEHINFIVNSLKKCKKSGDVTKALNDCYNKADETNKKINDFYNNFQEMPTFRRFQSLVKKFSVKYSDVTMEEKKKWYNIFVEYHKDMVAAVEPFDAKWINMVNTEINKCKKLDYETTLKIVKLIQAWYDAQYKYFNYTHNNIVYVIRKLDIGFEDSFKYKMIQKIFKSK